MSVISRPASQPRLALRLRVRSKRRKLDRALADRADPWGSDELACRARQLMLASTRRQLANVLLNLIDAAQEPDTNWQAHGTALPLRSQAVRDARRELLAVADRLRDPTPAAIRGVALAVLLVYDQRSPIFTDSERQGVSEWANRVLRALDDADRDVAGHPRA